VVHDVPAVPVGLFPDSEYDDTVLDLRPGARLYLHSDGLTEERNDQGVVFGRERIMAIVESARDEALETSIDRLIDATVSWKGDANLRDDVSVLAVDLKQ
jgi:sigma-B regulation protein RsbU (phosphoserine phosphatase)